MIAGTKYRSRQKEELDVTQPATAELVEIYRDLDRVNRILGGYRVSLKGVKKILGSACFLQPVRIVDIGCGNGSMLREIAAWGKTNGIKMELTGIDSSPGTIEIANEQSRGFPEIAFRVMDIRDGSLMEADIFLCTLTLHHFSDQEIVTLMELFWVKSRMGIVINDLHRTRWAYYLFYLFSAVFIRNKVARRDGFTSILRGFKRKELVGYGQPLPARKQILHWKWAFRYQWILLK